MTAAAETVWSAGEFGGVASRGGVLFGRMYEDAAVELSVFASSTVDEISRSLMDPSGKPLFSVRRG